ncbi:MAG: tetratricopeptide repeat protein [Emticicia sp.]|uniref:tetratricopeptide repeat protein n=1 Tax=Emticicia sp. TaxID=1930953 RepID=UPI003BA7739F
MTNVSQRNKLKIEAGKAFYTKNYRLASAKYQELSNISYNLEPEARLNLAHAYFSLNDTSRALDEYKKLLRLNNIGIATSAMIQVGVIETMIGDSLEAMQLFKIALQKDDQNKIARYNYELLRKKLPQSPPKNNQDQTTDTQNFNGGEVEKSEERRDELDSTTPEKMSKEKALQILEAMKTTELQYSQQHKQHSLKKNKVEKDW